MTAERRRIRLTKANLDNATLPMTTLRDFFPPRGDWRTATQKRQRPRVELILGGLREIVVIGIGSDAKKGKAYVFAHNPKESRCESAESKVPYQHPVA